MFIDATMFIFFNDGFSLTTTVGLAVCLAAIIFTLDSVFKLVSFRQHSVDKELLFY